MSRDRKWCVVRNINIDDLLTDSRPGLVEPLTGQSVDAMISAAKARDSIRKPRAWWKRPVVVFPIVGVSALAITAGAIAYSFGGTPDVVIPINYVTDNGHSVSCGYALHVGTEASTDASPLRTFVAEHDWSGIGQRVYREAITNPYIPAPAEGDKFTQDNLDRFSFDLALHTVISNEYPTDQIPAGVSGAESNCLGELR